MDLTSISLNIPLLIARRAWNRLRFFWVTLFSFPIAFLNMRRLD